MWCCCSGRVARWSSSSTSQASTTGTGTQHTHGVHLALLASRKPAVKLNVHVSASSIGHIDTPQQRSPLTHAPSSPALLPSSPQNSIADRRLLGLDSDLCSAREACGFLWARACDMTIAFLLAFLCFYKVPLLDKGRRVLIKGFNQGGSWPPRGPDATCRHVTRPCQDARPFPLTPLCVSPLFVSCVRRCVACLCTRCPPASPTPCRCCWPPS